MPHPTPLLCALRPQGGRVASVAVPHHLPVDSEGPESWCLGPSMRPKQPPGHQLVFCAHLVPLRPHLPVMGWEPAGPSAWAGSSEP